MERADGRRKHEIAPFGALLENYIRETNLLPRLKLRRFCEVWQEAVGEQVAARARVTGFQHGALIVEVDSPPLMQELRGFRQALILKCFQENEHTKDVRNISFRPAGPFRQQDAK